MLGGDGVDVAFAATLRFPGDVLAHFDAGLALAARDELEVVGDEGSLFLDDPWHCVEPVIELRRDGRRRADRDRARSTRTASRSRTSRRRSAARRAPLLGRDDALGQARTIEALYAAADRGETVELSS